MKVIIIGAGEVGYHLASWLSKEDKEIVVIDTNEEKLKRIENEMDVKTINGKGNSYHVLDEAGAQDAAILIAVTNIDEVNMIACLAADINFGIPQKIARIRNLEYIDNPIMLKQVGIDLAINPEKEVTSTIFNIIENPEATEIVDFEDGKVALVEFKVDNNTPIVNKKLKELSTENIPFLISGLIRDDKMIIPKGEHEIKAGDNIYIITKRDDLDKITPYIKKEVPDIKRIMIVGGSLIGEYVARQLEKQSLKVKLIEPDRKRCYELSDRLDKTIVINASRTDLKILKELNVEDVDCFIAVSEDEQENILACLIAKRAGARKTICLVNKSEYVPIARSIGIDTVISPRLSTASVILKLLRKGNILDLTALRENEAEVMEVVAQAKSSIVNKQLSKVNFPEGALIGAIIRDAEAIIPKGDDYIRPGDRVIIFTLSNAISSVEKAIKARTMF